MQLLVNGALSIPDAYKLPSDRPNDCEVRIVKEVEKLTRLIPYGVPEFDHFCGCKIPQPTES